MNYQFPIYLVHEETKTILPLVFGTYGDAMLYMMDRFYLTEFWIEHYTPYRENTPLYYMNLR